MNKISAETVEALRVKYKKDNDVLNLADFYDFVCNSPFYDSYVALRIMMVSLNDDLRSGNITLFVGVSVSEDSTSATIDEKTFMNAHKYATEIKAYHEQLKYLRENMIPQQITEAEKDIGSSLTAARKNVAAQIKKG